MKVHQLIANLFHDGFLLIVIIVTLICMEYYLDNDFFCAHHFFLIFTIIRTKLWFLAGFRVLTYTWVKFLTLKVSLECNTPHL